MLSIKGPLSGNPLGNPTQSVRDVDSVSKSTGYLCPIIGDHAKQTRVFGNILTHMLTISGLILGLRPANEKRRYKVTPSLIAWAQT